MEQSKTEGEIRTIRLECPHPSQSAATARVRVIPAAVQCEVSGMGAQEHCLIDCNGTKAGDDAIRTEGREGVGGGEEMFNSG